MATGAGIQFDAVMGAACLWFIASEGFSILENAALMGIPVPKIMLKLLEVMKEKGNAPEKASVGAQNAQEGASDMSGYHSCHGP